MHSSIETSQHRDCFKAVLRNKTTVKPPSLTHARVCVPMGFGSANTRCQRKSIRVFKCIFAIMPRSKRFKQYLIFGLPCLRVVTTVAVPRLHRDLHQLRKTIGVHVCRWLDAAFAISVTVLMALYSIPTLVSHLTSATVSTSTDQVMTKHLF